MTRRDLLTAAPAALAACGRGVGDYFGRTQPPRSQRLVYVKGIGSNAVDRQPFKYTWIDRNWRTA